MDGKKSKVGDLTFFSFFPSAIHEFFGAIIEKDVNTHFGSKKFFRYLPRLSIHYVFLFKKVLSSLFSAKEREKENRQK